MSGMNSNQDDINSLLGNLSRSVSQLLNRLQPTSEATGVDADASNSSSSSSSSTPPPTLPSIASRRPGFSNRFSPYDGRRRRKPSREPRRFDMKLIVVDYIPELFSSPSKTISTYRGEAVIETAFFLMEDDTANLVHDKLMDIIKAQFPEYDGDFCFVTRRNHNQLTIAANQDLDARGLRTLKGNGSVYIVLDMSVTPDDEVSFSPEFHSCIY